VAATDRARRMPVRNGEHKKTACRPTPPQRARQYKKCPPDQTRTT
jgi:hypothetical protein